MTTQQELDLLVAYKNVARSIEEIMFCTMHPQLTGTYRREEAIKTYATACVDVDKIKGAKL